MFKNINLLLVVLLILLTNVSKVLLNLYTKANGCGVYL